MTLPGPSAKDGICTAPPGAVFFAQRDVFVRTESTTAGGVARWRHPVLYRRRGTEAFSVPCVFKRFHPKHSSCQTSLAFSPVAPILSGPQGSGFAFHFCDFSGFFSLFRQNGEFFSANHLGDTTMQILKKLLCAAGLIAFAASAQAQNKELVVGSSATYRPFAYETRPRKSSATTSTSSRPWPRRPACRSRS